MKSTINDLRNNPDKLFHTTKDDVAKQLLFELGITDKFSIKVEEIESTNQFVTFDFDTHYIFAMLFTGKTLPSDNGYAVYCVPKSAMTIEQMNEFVKEQIQKFEPYTKYVHSVSKFTAKSSQN